MTAQDDELPLPQRSRAQVARDVVVFQVKLTFDGFRDLLLLPASLVVGIVSVVFSRRPGEPFYRLLRMGKSTEQWVNLFGEAYVDGVEEPDPNRNSEQWRELQGRMRDLDNSLRDGDYSGTAREGVARLRRSLKKFIDNR